MWSTKDERIQISSLWSCSGKDPGFSRGNLFVVGGAKFCDCINQNGKMIGINIRRYAVTEIEYMPRALPIAF